ncbi:porin [Chitinibacter fontanus]|uniref:Porin n=1 Tax=Chitinibacter fontanus TaxID=1737446 RepID=A0A7D5V8V5_9NEIS|nr:porin [Chitinibacter fontanus]QLI80692.1 porin [Chitinibacter fontanus]
MLDEFAYSQGCKSAAIKTKVAVTVVLTNSRLLEKLIMFKRVLMAAAVAAAVSAPAFADVSISGSAEMDFFYRTNNTADGDGKFLQEIAIVLNFDGKDKLDNGSSVIWRLASKVATPDRFDSFGTREAWIGYTGDWGTLKFGNQWSDVYLTQDWPYGSKGFSGTVGELPFTGFGSGITYASPSFGGFNFNLGYDFVDGLSGDAAAYEVSAHGAFGPINVDAGYAATKDATPVPAGVADWGTLTTKANRYAVKAGDEYANWILGARGNFGDFAVRALVRNFETKTSGTKKEQIGYLLSGTYNLGKGAVSLGYYLGDDAKVNGNTVDDSSFQTIGFQYDYGLSKNTGAFLQIRHNIVGKNNGSAAPIWQNADGLAKGDNATRILVGTWTGF